MKKILVVIGIFVAILAQLSTPRIVFATNLVVNGDFEQGRGVGWLTKVNNLNADDIIFNTDTDFLDKPNFPPRPLPSPTFYAFLGGVPNQENEINQTLALPNAPIIQLSFMMMTGSSEDSCTTDLAQLRVNGSSIKDIPLCKSQASGLAWKNEVVDLSQFRGSSISLSFWSKLNDSLNSVFLIDNVVITSQGEPNNQSGATLTVCPTGTVGENGCQYIGGEGIQQAVDAAQNEDTVLLKSGTYTRNQSIHYLNEIVTVENKNITIEGTGGSAILDGNRSSLEHIKGIRVTGTSQVTIKNLTITSMRNIGGVQFTGGEGLIVSESATVYIADSQIIDNVNNIKLLGNSRLVAERIVSSRSDSFGMQLLESATAQVKESQFNQNRNGILIVGDAQLVADGVVVSGNSGVGISVGSRSNTTEVLNSTLVNNGSMGIYLNSITYINNNPSVKLVNNIISGVRKTDITNMNGYAIGGNNSAKPQNLANDVINNNLIWNLAGKGESCGVDQICDFPGKIEADPLFVDPANGDYRLQPNSPACTGGEGGTHMGAFPCNQSDIGTLTDLTVTCSAASVSPPTATFSWKRQTTNPIEDHTIRINMVNACTNPLSQLLVPWYCPGSTANSEDQAHAFQVGGSSDSGRCSNGNCSVTLPIKRDTLYPEWSIEIAHVSNAFTTPRPLTRVNAPRFFCGTLQPGTISDMTVTCSSPSAASPTATFSWKRDSLYPIEVHNLRINMRNTCTGSNNQPIDWMCPDSTSNTEDQFRVIKIGGALDAGGSADTGNCTDGVCSVTVPVVADAVYDDWSVEATLPLPNNQSGVPLLRTANLPSFTCPSSLLGDVDGSGAVDQADLTALSAVLYTENCSYRLSANNPENCLVTIADYNELVSILRR